jgi:hypothetical protein
MTVNSLADDIYSYPYDDPNTPEDESMDGICEDELGRCTIRAAIEESYNMEEPVDLTFSVSGTITLIDFLYPYDGSNLKANVPIEFTADGPLGSFGGFEVENNTRFSGFRFNNMLTAIRITGKRNKIGDDFFGVGGNAFTNCTIALAIEGDTNYVELNYFGIDFSGTLGPNGTGILISGNWNRVGGGGPFNEGYYNIICGSTNTGISIAEGWGNVIVENFIGTNPDGALFLGNNAGIQINGSNDNLISENIISGNMVVGLAVNGVPGENNSTDNYISYNIIGLDSSKSSAIPNGIGIALTNGVMNNTIRENIIAGNSLSGIHIFGYDEETQTSGHIITNNRIGVNESGTIFPNGQNGINIWGNVEDLQIGTSTIGNDPPNIIVGNQGYGIYIADQFGYSPSIITARKNILYQNNSQNLFVSTLSNEGILPPYALSYNNNTIAGIHDVPGALIDVYKANINEFSPSAYEWLGSTTVGNNGVFSYVVSDPQIESVSLTATDNSGNTSGFAFVELITDVEKEDDQIPTEFSLNQNFPNPFNPSTSIHYQLPISANVEIKVFDVLGKEVETLVSDFQNAGSYEIIFNADSFSSGVYFYRIKAMGENESFYQIKKMLLIK